MELKFFHLIADTSISTAHFEFEELKELLSIIVSNKKRPPQIVNFSKISILLLIPPQKLIYFNFIDVVDNTTIETLGNYGNKL